MSKIIAIVGKCAVGKTTLEVKLEKVMELVDWIEKRNYLALRRSNVAKDEYKKTEESIKTFCEDNKISKALYDYLFYLMKEYDYKKFHRVISYTTRPMRPNEINGKDYYFVTDEEFDKILSEEIVYESTSYIVNGEKYRYCTVATSLKDDETNILISNVEGIKLLASHPEIRRRMQIYYLESSLEDRIERYMAREDKDDLNSYKRLVTRLNQDEKDFGSNGEKLKKICHKFKISVSEIVNNNQNCNEDEILDDIILSILKTNFIF